MYHTLVQYCEEIITCRIKFFIELVSDQIYTRRHTHRHTHMYVCVCVCVCGVCVCVCTYVITKEKLMSPCWHSQSLPHSIYSLPGFSNSMFLEDYTHQSNTSSYHYKQTTQFTIYSSYDAHLTLHYIHSFIQLYTW